MAINREIYRQFEDVVGPENICDDPAIMPAYYNTEFAAVVLPGNTAEVQAVVKLCNRHKIPFASVSVGWMGMFPKGIILMDLRRMNRIIEINEKNMYAVVEPYVINAQLQAELMKRGLNCNIKGAGSNGSAILKGHGHMDQTTSGDDRNYLAVEWVTPAGEIIRLGSLGDSGEWFCGDGPGPSLRAMISGTVPPGVTPGVLTKAAQKVYPWPGPTEFPIEGISPNYTLSQIPANMMVRYYSFPSVEKMYEAELKIGENEISYEVMCFNIAMVSSNISASNEEDIRTFERLRKEVKGPGFLVIIGGHSSDEFEYNRMVLERIVSEAGGESLKAVEDPKTAGTLLCQCIRVSASIRETFRIGGSSWGGFAVMGQRDLTMKWLQEAGQRKGALIEKGLAMDDGAAFFGCFGWGVEHGHLGKSEIFYRPTAHPDAAKAMAEWRRETNMRALEGCFAIPMGLPPEVVGPRVSNYTYWLQKINETFDPNGVVPK
ncbi:MAG: FAD-binding oxidoreductase, partial [Dehalococcoidales bacterium]|nr:FAD-binding oxidoreductase [Dehalococcoidales bacterium]